MKLVTWTQIENFCGAKIHRPSRTHVLGLVALGLLEKRLDVRGRVVVDSDALESAQATFEKGVETAQDRGIRCGTQLALARAGLLVAGIGIINSRAARRARKATANEMQERQLALTLPAAR
jgi:hypothetical protein